VVSPKRRTINRLVFDHLADHVNAVCQFSATSLAEKDGFRAPRIDVIPNGVDVPKYDRPADAGALRRTLGLAVNRRFIATIARFHPVKDHQTLLRAFAIVARARVDVDLLLVGDGALRGDLERLTATLGLTERVRFMGVRGDVADILKAVDVFALTSVSEAASITLLEAMAAETPVVVTAVGGNPEIVRQDVDGLLVPRGDAEAVAGALIRVLDDAAFARSLGASAGKRVRSEFLLDSTVERYFGLYAGSNDRPWAA
jgi:glycosyltransferase involved in cell wall biosynthesis